MKRSLPTFILLVLVLATIGGLAYRGFPRASGNGLTDTIRVWIAGGEPVLQVVAAPVSSAYPTPAAASLGFPTDEIVGPYRWRNVEIGGTGFITGIIFHPQVPGLVYARTDIGGAYRWNPEYKRWLPLQDWVGSDEWNLLGIESLALDPRDPQRVYLAAGTYTSHWGTNGTILRSSDQGKTWEKTPVPFKFGGNEDGRAIGERLAVDPNLGSVLWLGTRKDGLWKSEDHGKTWRQNIAFPVQGTTDGAGIGFVIYDAKSSPPGTASRVIYVGVASGGASLFRSTDAGATWQEVAGQPRGYLPYHGVLTPGGTFYLTYSDKPGPNGIERGAVWKLDTPTGRWTDITPLVPGSPGERSFGYAGLAVDARDPQTVMVATIDRWSKGDDIFRSRDGGQHWQGLAKKAVNDAAAAPYLNWGNARANFGHWIGDVEINPFDSEQAVYVTGATIWGTDHVSAADRGETTRWEARAQGIEETSVGSLLSLPVGPPLISGLFDVGGFRHDELDVSPPRGVWTHPIMNNTDGMDFAQKNPEVVVRVGRSQEARGAISTDGAVTWRPFGSEPPAARSDKQSHGIAIAADGGSIVWVAADGIAYVSRNQGANWENCQGLGAGSKVVADRVNARIFYALSPKEGRLFASQDGGASFAEVVHDLPRKADQLHATSVREGDLWLTAGDNGLWHSRSGGAGFEKVAGVSGAETVGFGKAAPGKEYDAIYLVGTVQGTRGVFRSDDGGGEWTRINDDRHRYGWIGRAITGDPKRYGRVYFATNGRGIVYGDPATP